MQCSHPIVGTKVFSGRPYNYVRRCGTCGPCRINRRKEWTCRILLEAMLHEQSIFTTLTYGPDYLPDEQSLSKRDCQLFLKRLRRYLAPTSFRYYCCGEYGARSERPHYHLVLFGFPIDRVSLILKAWQMDGEAIGMVHTAPLTRERAAYIAGYSTKKLSERMEPQDGREPVFSLMSNKPGLGHGFMPRIADSLRPIVSSESTGRSGGKLESTFPNGVPGLIRIGGSKYPLSAYLIDELLSELELPGRDSVEWARMMHRQSKTVLEVPILEWLDGREKSAARSGSQLRLSEMRETV